MALLWNPESWSQRLAELEAQSGDLKEAPLRRDVRSLGTLLGAVLREQAGDEAFSQVEALRQGTISRRDAEARGRAEEAARHAAAALELVHALPVERAVLLTRAFAFYFELINLAETNHRKRRRIALRLSGQAGRQRGSLEGTFCEMRRVGIGAEEALNWLRRVLIVPVFTAHPTEAARRTVMFKRRRIGEFLEALDRIPLPEQDMARLEELVLAEITGLWQTDEVRSRRPTVYDEIKMGLDYYDVSIFETLPELYREISAALHAAYGLEIEPLELPLMLRVGSWIGGDRDGNPFVTPDVTRAALQLARGHLLPGAKSQTMLGGTGSRFWRIVTLGSGKPFGAASTTAIASTTTTAAAAIHRGRRERDRPGEAPSVASAPAIDSPAGECSLVTLLHTLGATGVALGSRSLVPRQEPADEPHHDEPSGREPQQRAH